MPTNTLTDARCRAAKAGDKPVKLFDRVPAPIDDHGAAARVILEMPFLGADGDDSNRAAERDVDIVHHFSFSARMVDTRPFGQLAEQCPACPQRTHTL